MGGFDLALRATTMTAALQLDFHFAREVSIARTVGGPSA
jgi:hypothetical protein